MNAENFFREGTPVELYDVYGHMVRVKREDLCSPYPGPAFSKIRGVYAHIKSRSEQLIGVLDTFHSKGGWAVAYCCAMLGKDCIEFWPRYKADGDELREPQKQCLRLGANINALPAGRSAVLYHTAKARTWEEGGYMMPNALKLPESMSETAAEVLRTDTKCDTMVISISSATIASGVLRGLATKGETPTVILHMGYSRSRDAVLKYVREHAPDFPIEKIQLVDEGYAYKDKAKHGIESPFPSNPYYDLKAWQWIARELGAGRDYGQVVFWNIGE